MKTVLKRIDNDVRKFRPNTMDELISIVFSTTGSQKYGIQFKIVKYRGTLQGVRVYITGRSKAHVLPNNTNVYAVMQGTEKYESAGWEVINTI